jgi:hypothetical protein
MTFDPIPGSQTPDRKDLLHMMAVRRRFNGAACRHSTSLGNDPLFIGVRGESLLFNMQQNINSIDAVTLIVRVSIDRACFHDMFASAPSVRIDPVSVLLCGVQFS